MVRFYYGDTGMCYLKRKELGDYKLLLFPEDKEIIKGLTGGLLGDQFLIVASEATEELYSLIKTFGEVDAVIVCPNVDERKKSFKDMKVDEKKKLQRPSLEKAAHMMSSEAGKRGIMIPAGTAEEIADRLGYEIGESDIQTLYLAISMFEGLEGVSYKNVKALLPELPIQTAFALVDAIIQKQSRKAFELAFSYTNKRGFEKEFFQTLGLMEQRYRLAYKMSIVGRDGEKIGVQAFRLPPEMESAKAIAALELIAKEKEEVKASAIKEVPAFMEVVGGLLML